jgi:hypothetical protein
VSVILAALTSTLTAVIFVGFLLCAAAARGAGADVMTSAIALQRPDDAASGDARGDVVVQWAPTKQTVDVVVKGIRFDEPTDGLAVFLSGDPFDTNSFHLVNVLNGPGTNETWHLNLKDAQAAPAQLGVDDVRSLFGHYVRIVDVATNVYLEAFFPPFVTNIRSYNYKAHTQMQRPVPAPSPKATAMLRVKLVATTGASLLDVRARNLSAGNSYCL